MSKTSDVKVDWKTIAPSKDLNKVTVEDEQAFKDLLKKNINALKTIDPN